MTNKEKVNRELNNYIKLDNTMISWVNECNRRLGKEEEDKNIFRQGKKITKIKSIINIALIGIGSFVLLSNLAMPITPLINVVLSLCVGTNILGLARNLHFRTGINKLLDLNAEKINNYKEAAEVYNKNHIYNQKRIKELRNILENKQLTDEQIGKEFDELNRPIREEIEALFYNYNNKQNNKTKDNVEKEINL